MYLNAFAPLALALKLLDGPPVVVFFSSAVAVIPAAGLMSDATEQLSARSGPGIAGLLNVTFGNAPELIIAFFALLDGLQEVVKASLVGSIIGNSLLVLGAAMVAGGWNRTVQTFDRTAAQNHSGLLLVTVTALILPSVLALISGAGLPIVGQDRHAYSSRIEHLSIAISLVMIAVYVAGLFFSLRTHRDLFAPGRGEEPSENAPSLRRSIITLAGAGVLVGVMSELLVGLDRACLAVDRPVAVLRRRVRRRDRRQRRRALRRGRGGGEGQDGPGGQHRDRLERPDRVVRRARARPALVPVRSRTDGARVQRL